MTGDPEYIKDRSQDLVSTFSSLLDTELRLEDYPHGETDCETFIRAPMSDREGYLVVEHELSHVLFGTDLSLTEAFRKKAVERLLRRAKIPASHRDADAYKPKLDALLHHLWNILEDWRCCWLWSQIYPGGGELLATRWKDIAKYEMGEKAENDLLTYMARRAAGTETDASSDTFKECGKHMIRAKNLVEGVDAASCLAITARLVDDIADELLDKYPPNKTEEAKKKLNALCQAVSTPADGSQAGDVKSNPMGGKDLADPPKKKKPTAGQMKRIQQVLTAKHDNFDEDADGQSTFSKLMQLGSDKMEVRLEEARQAMSVQKMSAREQEEDILNNACKTTGTRGVWVDPVQTLPPPSSNAAKIRHELEKVRMKKKRRRHEDGDDLDVEAFIEARINGELSEAKLFTTTRTESGMELLILGDESGSMIGSGMAMLERAISDVVYACGTMKVEVQYWAFSDTVYFFRKIGSPRGVPGLSHGLTNMVQALDVAYEWAKSSKTTRAVILMTDGMPTSLRGRNSSGNVLVDLHAVLDEMRKDGIVLSILAIGNNPGLYDKGFGERKYALLRDMTSLTKALPETAKQLVEAHILRGHT
jgi:hypothetical protein